MLLDSKDKYVVCNDMWPRASASHARSTRPGGVTQKAGKFDAGWAGCRVVDDWGVAGRLVTGPLLGGKLQCRLIQGRWLLGRLLQGDRYRSLAL